MQQTLTDNGYPIALIKRSIKQGRMTVKKIKDKNVDIGQWTTKRIFT